MNICIKPCIFGGCPLLVCSCIFNIFHVLSLLMGIKNSHYLFHRPCPPLEVWTSSCLPFPLSWTVGTLQRMLDTAVRKASGSVLGTFLGGFWMPPVASPADHVKYKWQPTIRRETSLKDNLLTTVLGSSFKKVLELLFCIPSNILAL